MKPLQAIQTKEKREPKLKTVDGPLEIIWTIAGKEVTKERAKLHIEQLLREKRRERRL